jgi:hypothetical protein
VTEDIGQERGREETKVIMLAKRLPKEVRRKLQREMGIEEGKEHKYNAKSMVVEGVRYDSIREYDRYQELVMKQKAGLIRGLKRQVVFRFIHNGIHVGKYVADATYYEPANGRKAWDLVVEDTKGVRTPLYRRSKKMMIAFYGIEIRET